MSQIVMVNSIVIRDLELAKKVAEQNNFIFSENELISGIGDKDSRYKFSHINNHINFGLVEIDNRSFSIKHDVDYTEFIMSNFVAKYSKELLKKESILSGRNSDVVSENEDEVVIEIY